MTDIPTAEIVAVQLHGDGNPQCIGKVRVVCPYCEHTHPHRVFRNDSTAFTRVAPCTGNDQGLRYRIDLNPPLRPVPKRNVSEPHLVNTDRDDNAIDVPVPNWEE